MQPWSKEIIIKAIKANKPIKFVDTIEEVENLVNYKTYGIEKDSPVLKELIQEGRFPVDNRFLNLKEGFYYIINIEEKRIEIKSEVKNRYIAYAVYKEAEDKNYWNKVYQIIINPILGETAINGTNTLEDYQPLIGRTIHIKNIITNNKEKNAKQIIWLDTETEKEMISEIYAELEDIEAENEWMQEAQIQAEIGEQTRQIQESEDRMFFEIEEEGRQAEDDEQRMFAEIETEMDDAMLEASAEAQIELEMQNNQDADSCIEEIPDDEHFPE